MEIIYYLVLSLGSAWGVTKLLIAANASVGLTDYCPWICDMIHSMGCDVRTVVFWLLLVVFIVTGLPLKVTRSLVPIFGWGIVAIIALIAVAVIWGVISCLINSL